VPGPTQEFQFSAAPGAWRLSRAEPADDLRGLVLEYWEVEGALSAFRETLLPNGAVEVMINLGPPHRVLSATGQGVWERAWFSGLHEHAIIIESLAGTHLLSARLHALGAVALLGRRVVESVNRIVDLDTFIESGGDALRVRALSATTVANRFEALETFLRTQRANGEAVPEFVRIAAERIEQAHGNLRVASLHEQLDVSRKHLAVSFRRYAGVSMKAYAKIRRFMWTLTRLQQSTSVS